MRSFAFTTQGRLHSQDIAPFLMPTLLSDTNLFLWVDLEAATGEEAKMVLDEIFHFHPLSIEDCRQESATPKVEEYFPKDDDRFSPYLFMVIHAVDYSRKGGVFATTELNFFLGRNYLVTYHDAHMRSVQAVEDRCRKGTVHVARAPDRVAHTLLDSIVDNYKPALEELAYEIADLEQQVIERQSREIIRRILGVKKEVMHLRQIIGPQREVLARFARGEFKLVRAHLVPYYRDVYDALFTIGERAQAYADSLTNVLQVSVNLSSQQTGEVIKLLTLITVATTPIMVVGTWYGMNFEGMPELGLPHAYLGVTVLTVAATVLTLLYFRRRGWLGSEGRADAEPDRRA